MKVPYIDLKGQHKLLKKELLKAYTTLLDRSDFILGQPVVDLEEKFARYCGTRYALGVNSGTDALFLAMVSLGIGNGDEVMTAPNSFLATASSIAAAGAKPVFVDVGEDMNLDPTQIESKITPQTKAILPVHLTGKPASMDPILKIAKKHNLFVIEDAAQAMGTEYHGKRAGSFGIANCFSLHPLKTLNACGDGGMITTNDKKVYNTISQLRNIGLKNRSESDLWGFNSRLDSLQAAIVNVKFRYLDQWIAKRRDHAAYYRKHLEGLVTCPIESRGEKCAYHLFVVQTEKRDALQSYLTQKGIETKIHYPIPIHLQRCAKSLGYKKGDFPVTERQSERILSLPIYQTLTRDQLDYVIETITHFFKN
ncbi:MAG: DegT/DnrJ/EryC1/StrS family aminotransferase [Elusimicrobia bacterium]|nr:DegT/DnrJ/EryC1/StrS family aminotransferase [Elusimicrobiota bacterium]